MKTKIIFSVIVIAVLGMGQGCKKPLKCVDCGDDSFFTENYLKNIQSDKIFFIKGVALDTYMYGRNVRIIEDLKGNFSGKSSIFVWGIELGTGIKCFGVRHKVDYINHHDINDTLVMILEEARKRFHGDVEKRGDYTTIACEISVLKLSNDTVTGRIYHSYPYAQTALWTELQKELNNKLNKK